MQPTSPRRDPAVSVLRTARGSSYPRLSPYVSLSRSLLSSGWGTPAFSIEGYPVDSTHLHPHHPAIYVCTKCAWKITHTSLPISFAYILNTCMYTRCIPWSRRVVQSAQFRLRSKCICMHLRRHLGDVLTRYLVNMPRRQIVRRERYRHWLDELLVLQFPIGSHDCCLGSGASDELSR